MINISYILQPLKAVPELSVPELGFQNGLKNQSIVIFGKFETLVA